MKYAGGTVEDSDIPLDQIGRPQAACHCSHSIQNQRDPCDTVGCILSVDEKTRHIRKYLALSVTMAGYDHGLDLQQTGR